MIPILYSVIAIAVFMLISIYAKRKRNEPESIFYNTAPDEMFPPVLMCSALWPIAIPLIVTIMIGAYLYRFWSNWLER
jgi:hypothetical protein